MAIKTTVSSSPTAYYVEKRKKTRTFLQQIDQIIKWEPIQRILEKYYTKGQNNIGRKAYPALVLFKMALLQTWYKLSDYGVEDQVNDSLSFMRFCGLQLEDEVPDHSVLCRFRKILTRSGAWEVILTQINQQLSDHNLLVKQGSIVDASVTESPRKPHGKNTYSLTGDQQMPLKKQLPASVDQEGSWVKKNGTLRYGYKRHYLTESKEGLVLAVHTTAANAHESKHLKSCLDKVSLPPGSRVLADKGYCSGANEALLRTRGFLSGIQRKGSRNHPLCASSKAYNKAIGRDRYKIERVFGSISRWFGGLRARYVGLLKTHGQHVLEGIAYNLYRVPGLIVSSAH